jgi:arylsulfatase A-like enzyme
MTQRTTRAGFCQRSGRVAFAMALLGFVLCHGAAAAPPAPPNVIFILADDMGYADLGCFGQKLIKTPNIERLAERGMRFTQAYAGATACAPSRCSLMTGKHNGHAAIRGNKEIQPEGQAPIPADTFTVAHLLKHAGYATGLAGKRGLATRGRTVRRTGWDSTGSSATTASARRTSITPNTSGATMRK